MKRYQVEYACLCSVGRLRRNNEDNFYCGGHIREDVDSADDVAYSGCVSCDANELFAVFDGMGGESCGEVASFIAAEHSRSFLLENKPSGEYLYQLAEILNERVREETEARSLVIMGTTAAMLEVAGETVYIVNVGDSRIYKLSRHEMKQISREHIDVRYGGKALTKFLGMPEGHELDPYIAMGKYKAGDMFLLCSDGLTDMLSDEEITSIMDSKNDLNVVARELVDAALERGGIDNTTVILLRFKK